MSSLFLALFLVIFGLNVLFSLGFPSWLTGALALIAGVLMLVERFQGRGKRA